LPEGQEHGHTTACMLSASISAERLANALFSCARWQVLVINYLDCFYIHRSYTSSPIGRLLEQVLYSPKDSLQAESTDYKLAIRLITVLLDPGLFNFS